MKMRKIKLWMRLGGMRSAGFLPARQKCGLDQDKVSWPDTRLAVLSGERVHLGWGAGGLEWGPTHEGTRYYRTMYSAQGGPMA